MDEKFKKLYVKQKILVDIDNNDLCGCKCDGFADEITPPTFKATCKMFLAVQSLSIYSINRDKNFFFITKFNRCQECKNKELKDGS